VRTIEGLGNAGNGARERLEDPERARENEERAKAEGWTVPTDEAGTSPREG